MWLCAGATIFHRSLKLLFGKFEFSADSFGFKLVVWSFPPFAQAFVGEFEFSAVRLSFNW